MPGFWACAADITSGNRLIGAEERFVPGPSGIISPDSKPGVLLESSGGRTIWQSPSNDPRMRAFTWSNLVSYRGDLMRLIGRLEGLVASTRRARGLSPYVYLRDMETKKLRRLISYQGTVTSATTTTLTDTSQSWTVNDISAGYGVLEVIQGAAAGQRRSVVSNTINQLVLQSPLSVAPVGSQYSVQYNSDVWVRCRVTKQLRQRSGSPTYEQVSLNYVISDPVWSVQDYG
jgi:hypothetical protein